MENINQYRALFFEVIAKEAVILGLDITILKARNAAIDKTNRFCI